jgi:hypothetical protein
MNRWRKPFWLPLNGGACREALGLCAAAGCHRRRSQCCGSGRTRRHRTSRRNCRGRGRDPADPGRAPDREQDREPDREPDRGQDSSADPSSPGPSSAPPRSLSGPANWNFLTMIHFRCVCACGCYHHCRRLMSCWPVQALPGSVGRWLQVGVVPSWRTCGS